jgi:hypothetical protein
MLTFADHVWSMLWALAVTWFCVAGAILIGLSFIVPIVWLLH